MAEKILIVCIGTIALYLTDLPCHRRKETTSQLTHLHGEQCRTLAITNALLWDDFSLFNAPETQQAESGVMSCFLDPVGINTAFDRT